MSDLVLLTPEPHCITLKIDGNFAINIKYSNYGNATPLQPIKISDSVVDTYTVQVLYYW